MKKLGLLSVVGFSLVVLSGWAAEDLTGKWSGSFEGPGPDGQAMHETVVLNIVHKGTALTGTAGPADERQWPILKGKVDGNDITFEVQAGGDSGEGPVLAFALKFADGHLKGDVKAEHEGVKLNAKLDATRVK